MKVCYEIDPDVLAAIECYSFRTPNKKNALDSECIALVEKTVANLDGALAALDINYDITIGFANNLGKDALGVFIHGTSGKSPVVLLAPKSIQCACVSSGLSLEVGVSTTIYHEFAHALCELDRDYFDNEFLGIINDEEDWAEDFAYEFYTDNFIPERVGDLLTAFHSSDADFVI